MIKSSLFALSLLMVASQASAQTADSLSETYGQWIVACETQEGTQICEASQRQNAKDSGQLVMKLAFFYNNEGKLTGQVLAPFGLDLGVGVSLTIDTGAAQTVPFASCYPAGCVALFDAPEEMVALLKAGQNMTVGLVAFRGEPLNLSAPLDGLARAMERLAELTGH